MEKQMLKRGWFVKESVGQTVRNILQVLDSDFINRATETDFGNGLMTEIRFIGAYESEDLPRVEKYIRAHRKQLYEEAKQIAKKRTLAERVR